MHTKETLKFFICTVGIATQARNDRDFYLSIKKNSIPLKRQPSFLSASQKNQLTTYV